MLPVSEKVHLIREASPGGLGLHMIIGMLLPGYGGYNLDACMPSQRHCLFDLLGSFARLHPWLSQRTSRAVKFVAIL